MPVHKSLAFVVREYGHGPQLLVFASLDARGFEVPRGRAEQGESPAACAARETLEESGVAVSDPATALGTVAWQDETQHGFVFRAPAGLPDAWLHRVTAGDADRGLEYALRWLDIGPLLRDQLAQGCGEFVDSLLAAI